MAAHICEPTLSETTQPAVSVAAAPMFGIRSVRESCRHIADMIGVAAAAGVQIIVFPETATNSYQPTALEDRQEIESHLPMIQEATRDACGPWVILGTFTYQGSSPANSALVIDPQGCVRSRYHKMSDGGARWLMLDICGLRATVIVCADFWVPGVLAIPKMLGAQVCLYPHGSGAVSETRRDWSPLYYTRAWESKMFLVMADCSWCEGDPFTRPDHVPYPYDYQYHQLNQSCIISPEPRYLARTTDADPERLLVAGLNPGHAVQELGYSRYAVGRPWRELLDRYIDQGHVEWMA